MSGRVLLGTQSWNYPDWVGPFYPDGTRPADFLATYARAFPTVEVDSSFYAVPSAGTVLGWRDRTPPGFVLSLKLPREITHDRRLRGAEGVLAEFLDRARLLGEKLGPVLVQLGPDFSPAEGDSLRAFLDRMPADVRFAVEFRQAAWITKETHELLSERRVALALSDGDGRWVPRRWLLALAQRPTADFHYLRWMGPDRESLTDYSRVQVDRSEDLDLWADALRDLPGRGIDLYGYFNNHFAGHSPASARDLQRRLGVPPVSPDELAEQTSLF